MTAYTAIPDSDIDPESPGTSSLFTSLRDNPIAITEGASGAPKIAPEAVPDFNVTGTLTAFSSNHEIISTNSTSYVKIKEVYMIRSGTVQVLFDLSRQASSSITSYGRIYVDGVAVGTQRTTTSDVPNYVSFTENISVTAGEKLQLYIRSSAIASTYNNVFLVRSGVDSVYFGAPEYV